MSDDIQVNLRLPVLLKDKIHDSARHNNRSLNAELNERLMQSFITVEDNYTNVVAAVLDLASRFQTSDRLHDIKQRLDFLLEQLRNISHAPFFNPSLIASKLGYDYATETEKWFKGEAEPSFSQLKLLAKFFGCDESWLQFGIGKPFPTKNFSQFRDIVNVVDFLTTPEPGFSKVNEILFVRKDSAAGELLIIKVFDDYRSQTYQTSVHLSDVVGATGTLYRAVITLVFRALLHSHWKLKVKSYLVKSDMYETLTAGEKNALSVLNRYPFSNWMDDIWDSSMYMEQNQDENWKGWRDLCLAISSSIEIDNKLKLDKEMITNNSHEAITLLNERFYKYFDN